MKIDKAKSVINELKLYVEDLPHYSPDEVAEAFDMAIKALEQKSYKSEARRWKRRYLDLKQRIFKLEEQTRWIPVSERLPEETTRVLIYTDTNEITFGVLSNNHWRVSGYKYGLYDGVLAWMPLPQPYNVESEDKET